MMKACPQLHRLGLVPQLGEILTNLPTPSQLDPVLVILFEALPSITIVKFLISSADREFVECVHFPPVVELTRKAFPEIRRSQVPKVFSKLCIIWWDRVLD